jgi:hypothetical protein
VIRVEDKNGVVRLINPRKVITATLKGAELLVEMEGKDEPFLFLGRKRSEAILKELEEHGK